MSRDCELVYYVHNTGVVCTACLGMVSTFSCSLRVNSEKQFGVMRWIFLTGKGMCTVCKCTCVERAHVAIEKELIGVIRCSVIDIYKPKIELAYDVLE